MLVLETRVVPYSTITTPYYQIPNFGDNPTVSALVSGAWSNPAIWSTGQVPAAGSIVSIGAGDVITYDVVSDAAVKTVAVQNGGSLQFRTDVSTRLTVVNLLVMDGGELRIGTAAAPVAAAVKAEVVFADVALDTANDPYQYGNGLIAFGKVTMCGAGMSDTFVSLASEPLAGTVTLALSKSVTGWRPGDRLIVPDTRQIPDTTPQWERPAVTSISPDGLTVTLSQPLQFSHLGARDGSGTLRFLPHVGDLTRNVVVRSQSATGTRGQTFFTQRADIDIRYAQFSGLGRTQTGQTQDSNGALAYWTWPNDPVFNANGTVASLPANQEGRYPIHFANLVGPVAIPANGYQFTFLGNSVFCPLDPMTFRWGIDIDASSYGLVKDNVLYNWGGAGIVTEEGSETKNVIEHNYVVRTTSGDGRADARSPTFDANFRGYVDIGFEGSGFWFHGPDNYVRGNVAADGPFGFTGYEDNVLWPAPGGTVRMPAYQGADRSVAGQYTTTYVYGQSLREFSNNEAYGVSQGLTFWSLGSAFNTPITSTPESLVQNFHVWHNLQYGYYGYPSYHVTFDGLVAINDSSIIATTSKESYGLWFSDYRTDSFAVRNADIEGYRWGIYTSSFGANNFTVQDSELRNVVNILIDSIGAAGSCNDSTLLPARSTIIRNVRFDHVPSLPANVPADHPEVPRDITMYYDSHGGFQNLIVSDRVLVYDFNQTPGDNFQVFYTQQDTSFVLPQTVGSSIIGSPVAGLTNQQNWSQYGIAMGGMIAPSTQTRTGIWGFVSPIGSPFGGTLAGRAYRDSNKNGVIDANEPGEPNLTVYLDLNGNQLRDANELSATTDVNGNYSLNVNSDGAYVVRLDFANAGTLFQTTSNPLAVNVAGGATVLVSPAFGVTRPGGTVTGIVYFDANRNGQRDPSENAEVGVQVFIDANNDGKFNVGEVSSVTSAAGAFAMNVATDGKYSVRQIVRSGQFASTTNPASVTLSGGGSSTLNFGSTSVFVAGSGAGTTAKVQVYNPDGSLRTSITPYSSFAGGVRVATGDIDRDGVPDIITAPGAGGGPDVRVFSGVTYQLIREFFAYAANMASGVFVSTGDVDGDGRVDIITGAGVGIGVHNEPRVRVFSGVNNAILRDFIAYPTAPGASKNSYNVGATVAAADFNNDGKADIVVGPESGNPNVIVYSGADNSAAPARLRDYFAYAPVTPGGSQFYPLGAYVAVGDYNGDGAPDIITGAGINVATGVGGGSHVRVFSGGNVNSIALEFFAYPNLTPEFRGGVRVGAVDLDGDGKVDLLAAPGKTDATSAAITRKIRAYKGSQASFMDLTPFTNFLGGSYVG